MRQGISIREQQDDEGRLCDENGRLTMPRRSVSIGPKIVGI